MDLYDNAKNMLNDVKNNIKDKKFKQKMINKYSNLYEKRLLFDKIYSGDFSEKDDIILRKMCEIKHMRDQGKIDKDEGDKVIGQVIFDNAGGKELLEKLDKQKMEKDNNIDD
tara:strand:+ start:192 stop:527 length:336 start_codon:yes stop_codon:yes gene_type:complete